LQQQEHSNLDTNESSNRAATAAIVIYRSSQYGLRPCHLGRSVGGNEKLNPKGKSKEKSGKREEVIIVRDDALVGAWFCCRSHEEKEEGRRTKSNGGGSERARKESEPQKDK